MPEVKFTKKGADYGVVLSYTLGEIGELSANGYFLEAFGRLDKMLDQTLFALMHKRFSGAEDLVSGLVDDNMSGFDAAKALNKSGALSADSFKRIRQFKEARNIVAHDIYGHYALALKQAGEIQDSEDLKNKGRRKGEERVGRRGEGFQRVNGAFEILRVFFSLNLEKAPGAFQSYLLFFVKNPSRRLYCEFFQGFFLFPASRWKIPVHLIF
ncbi:hypothetical protein HZC09_05645 [Candidatus Micrarchaeota archaeon]|nr:hypothetical protein [Candidatus Micrarchaeota archaeon]